MNIVIVSSMGQCGVHECAQILKHGLQKIGHHVRFIGVRKHDSRDLLQKIRQLTSQDEVVIFEYEPGIFWPYGLIKAMLLARFWRRKMVILSIHEFAPNKFTEFNMIQDHLEASVRFTGVLEWMRVLWTTGWVALWYAQVRFAWRAMTRLPHAIIVHSITTVDYLEIGLDRSEFGKVFNVPLAVKPILGNRNEARHALGLPLEPFVFIIPGFIFRRKRIIEVIEQLPPRTELWIVGVTSEQEQERGCLGEIRSYLESSSKASQVRIIQEYGVEPYIQAADAVVLFYQEIFQSAVASQAIGAGKPCIFSDLPGFAPFKSAGLTVRSLFELRQAMEEIQEPTCYHRLVEVTRALREQFSPEQTARHYMETLEPNKENNADTIRPAAFPPRPRGREYPREPGR